MTDTLKYPEKIYEAVIFGLRVVYSDTGADQRTKASKKPVIVFIHDWCSNRHSFAEQIKAFSNDYRCIAIDLPGHGRSSKPSLTYSIILMAEIVAGFVKSLKLENLSLVGHGLGCNIALETAHQLNDGADNLILVNPAILFSETKNQEKIEDVQQQSVTLGFRAYVNTILESRYFLQSDANHYKDWAKRAMTRVPEDVGKSILSTCFDWPGKSVLRASKDKSICCIFSSEPNHEPGDLNELVPGLKWGKTLNQSFYGHLTAPKETNALMQAALLDQ